MSLNKNELAELRQTLEQRYDALRGEVRAELDQSESQQLAEMLDGESSDVGDQSVADAIADLNLATLERHVREMRDIEQARARMREGKFGTCIACGEPIGIGRLRAYPTAKRCLACQQRYEQREAGPPHARL